MRVMLLMGLLLGWLPTAYTAGLVSQTNPQQTVVNVDLFVSSRCAHCQRADAFFKALEQQADWLVVHRYVINEDRLALTAFYDKLRATQSNNFSVPAIFFCGSHWIGYESAETTGNLLIRALNYCEQEQRKTGGLDLAAKNLLHQWGVASQFNLDATLNGSKAYLIMFMGLMDSLNGCSFFLVAVLLGVFIISLSMQKNKRLFVGGVAMLSLFFVHALQFVHPYAYQVGLLWSRGLAVLTGLLLLYALAYGFRHYRITGSVRFNAIMAGIIGLTLCIVYVEQQRCLLSMPVIFEEWLLHQPVSQSRYLMYVVLYNAVYILPLLLLWGIATGLRKWSFSKPYLPTLTIISGLLLSGVALLLIVYPSVLSNAGFSAVFVIASILIGRLVSRQFFMKDV